MDYNPKPGPPPSQAIAENIRRWQPISRGQIIVQDAGQTYSGDPNLPKPTLALPKPKQSTPLQSPYGPDFTEDGMCNWNTYIAPMLGATEHNGKWYYVDTFWMEADHRHKCRPCRDHISGLVQDLEGELHAAERYDDP